MKKIWKYLLASAIIFLLAYSYAEAQVILEHQYYIYKKNIYLINLGDNDYKYAVQDSTGFSLYNLDHSPYLLNIIAPIPLWRAPTYYQACYITKSLFDCDSTNIEYVVTNGIHGSNFYIFRTDGTQIFERDSVTGSYAIGYYDGSLIAQPIVNTPNGTKLFLQDNNSNGIDSEYIYSLCGTLPISISEVPLGTNYIHVFPNPSNGIINFQISQPNNLEKFKLTIYNSALQKVDEVCVDGKNYQLDTKQKALAADTYLFDLRTEFKVYQIGKFVITK
jgi:hypothetical protein